jgi:hypothetical protein
MREHSTQASFGTNHPVPFDPYRFCRVENPGQAVGDFFRQEFPVWCVQINTGFCAQGQESKIEP